MSWNSIFYKAGVDVSSLKCLKPKIPRALKDFPTLPFHKTPFHLIFESWVAHCLFSFATHFPSPFSSLIILPTVCLETYFPHMRIYAHTITNNYQRADNSSLDTVNSTVRLSGPFSIILNRSTAGGREDLDKK